MSLPEYLSLGAGVQSSAMALMFSHGELQPMPKAAVFADTQAEPASVYRWLDWLEQQLAFPVVRVTAGDLGAAELELKYSKRSERWYRKNRVPVFIRNEDGSKGIFGRGCTRDYKINPIRKWIKQDAGIKGSEVQCVQCIGISTDEFQRMKPARDPWWKSRWPLIEQRISRQGCIDWMQSHGYPEPPRSACKWCPFHSDAEWRRLQKNEPAEFAEAVQFEREVQQASEKCEATVGKPFFHSSLKPLDEVDFRSDVEKGQLTLWNEECEGMCGI